MRYELILLLFLTMADISAFAENVTLSPDDSAETVIAKAVSVRPTSRQIAWQRDEVSAFVHFGMNTFTDREWGDGTEDPRTFNPTELDCRQWARAAKAAGITRMILTAKHHDGFCLWPTQYTEHCVRNSPWRDGKGDVVGEFIDACRAEGIHYGIYISPWDRHEPSYGDSPKYNAYFLNQLREVLTNYPGVQEVWFDGACAEGPNGKRQEYDWRAYWQLIRELTPDATISVRGPDVRWCGNEAGSTRPSEWSVIPLPGERATWETSDKSLAGYKYDIFGEDLGSREALMNARQEQRVLAWYPAQVNTSIRPGWFYHTNEDDRVRSLPDLLNVYRGSVGGNGQFLLNIPPDRCGLFHENDVARLKELGKFLNAAYSTNLAAGAELQVEVDGGEDVGEVATLLDSDPDTFVTTTENAESLTLTVKLPSPVTANCLMLQEHIASGQRVEAFEVEVYTDGEWRRLASSTVIGHKRLLAFPETDFSQLRLRVTQSRLRPTIAEVGLFLEPAILAPPVVRRSLEGIVSIETPRGMYARYTLDGSNPTIDSPRYDVPFSLAKGGTVIARMFAQSGDGSIIDNADAVARAEFGLAKSKWRVVACNSEDAGEGQASNAIDDDRDTFWHTRYRDGKDPMPHHITVDMGESVNISAFTYTPRQDQWEGGIILRAKFEVSRDGKSWEVVADDVPFDNVVNSRQQQVVRLPNRVDARYFRLTALQSAKDEDLASASEVSVIVEASATSPSNR